MTWVRSSALIVICFEFPWLACSTGRIKRIPRKFVVWGKYVSFRKPCFHIDVSWLISKPCAHAYCFQEACEKDGLAIAICGCCKKRFVRCFIVFFDGVMNIADLVSYKVVDAFSIAAWRGGLARAGHDPCGDELDRGISHDELVDGSLRPLGNSHAFW